MTITTMHPAQFENFSDLHLSFLSYVMNDFVNVYLPEMRFVEVNQPFLKAEARYVTSFTSDEGNETREFWIIYKKGEPMAICVRDVKDGKPDPEVEFVQFLMRRYHWECVQKAINALPFSIELLKAMDEVETNDKH